MTSSILYVAWDTETTGLDPLQHDIIQLAAVCVSGSFETLIKSKVEVPVSASKVHGIYSKDLEFAPSLQDALKTFIEYLNNQIQKSNASTVILLGHNSWKFDDPYLAAALLSIYDFDKVEEIFSNLNAEFLTADTMEAARKTLKSNTRISLKLIDLLKHFTGRALHNAHTAKADAEAVLTLLPYVKHNLENKKWLESAMESLRRRYNNKILKYPTFTSEIGKKIKHPKKTIQIQFNKEGRREKSKQNLICAQCGAKTSRYFHHDCALAIHVHKEFECYNYSAY